MIIISDYNRKLWPNMTVLSKMTGFVTGLGGAWAHTITHDISTQMVHCHPVKMGLTTEVKGSLCGILYSDSRMLLCIHERAIWLSLYSTSLPMCYCIHVKDGLPQLGFSEPQTFPPSTHVHVNMIQMWWPLIPKYVLCNKSLWLSFGWGISSHENLCPLHILMITIII